jgi:hypothetical protein
MLKTKIEDKKIFNTILIIIFSFSSMVCYSDSVIALETEEQVQAATDNEQLLVENVTIEKAKSEEFCVAESFNGLISWFAEKFEFIDEKYLHNSDDKEVAEHVEDYDLTEEKVLRNKPLDLTIPDVEHEGVMEISNGIESQLPDLFADQTGRAYVKEKPSASFGGRILMDDEELEGMEEYRLKDMKDAVRGAEVSLEFKTN